MNEGITAFKDGRVKKANLEIGDFQDQLESTVHQVFLVFRDLLVLLDPGAAMYLQTLPAFQDYQAHQDCQDCRDLLVGLDRRAISENVVEMAYRDCQIIASYLALRDLSVLLALTVSQVQSDR